MAIKKTLWERPSAYVPITMSLVTLAVMLTEGVTTGFVRQADEGTAAHIFQILMPGQLPIIAYFALRYLREKPKQAFLILSVQIALIIIVCFPVFYFKL